jgi:DNA-binding GntR family transcriptional regulator
MTPDASLVTRRSEAPTTARGTGEPHRALMIYGKLRAMLSDGRFVPGAKLKLRDLAQEFGTSNTPVREALNRLTAERVLENAQNRTVIVPIPTVAEVRESRRIRMELEGFAAAEAAARITAAEMENVEKFHNQYLQARQAGDAPRMQLANGAFHFTIYNAARMPMLLEIIENFWLRNGPLQRLLHQVGTEPLRPSDRLHQEIVAALHARDPDKARQAMRDDIAYPTDAIIVALAEIRESINFPSVHTPTGLFP